MIDTITGTSLPSALSKALNQPLTLTPCDPNDRHLNEHHTAQSHMLMCTWEHVLLSGHPKSHAIGVIEQVCKLSARGNIRRIIINMIPSMMTIHRELLLIEPNLPTYEHYVIPAIYRALEPHFETFSKVESRHVLNSADAHRLAVVVGHDIGVFPVRLQYHHAVSGLILGYIDDEYRTHTSDDDVVYQRVKDSVTLGRVARCMMTDSFDIFMIDEQGNESGPVSIEAGEFCPMVLHHLFLQRILKLHELDRVSHATR